MISLDLTYKEILQFQHILPVQGSFRALEMVEKILKKIEIEKIKEASEEIKKIVFEENEILFLQDMISFLDEQKKLSFSSFSLIKKILDKKEITNG